MAGGGQAGRSSRPSPRALAAIGVLALLAAPAASALADAAAAPAAPDWTLPGLDGARINLHDRLAGGPVVVSFWATWCLPCLKEMPHLDALAAEFAGRATVIAVNVDQSRSLAKVGPLVRARGWDDLVIALDTAGTVQQLLQVINPPYVILYDASGREAYRHEGYRQGDELALRQALQRTLARTAAASDAAAAGDEASAGRPAPPAARSDRIETIAAANQFEYSYSTGTEAEIVENWLDVSVRHDGFRVGALLNHQGPSEEGNRRNAVVHRFAEFRTGSFDVRVGHFYGLFGRGLVWNSYEDRALRVDTALDGVYARGGVGPLAVQVLSGATGTTPVFDDPDGVLTNQVDVRGLDLEVRPLRGLALGGSGLTFRPRLPVDQQDVRREWVGTARLDYRRELAGLYLEYGRKTGYEFDRTDAERQAGKAFYGNLALYLGPLSLSLERSLYERFTVLERSDGTQPLNRPPALVREHLYTLLGRKPHAMDQNDEEGWQLEALGDLGRGWTTLGNAGRIETGAGEVLYQEIYGHLEREHLGPLRLRGGFGYQESEGALRQTVVGDATWHVGPALAWSLVVEHQHVRQGVLGAHDQRWFKLALDLPPRWTIDAMLETNNKHPAQFDAGEITGSRFASGQVSYALDGGGSVNLWFGERQAGQLCAGGVCKFEPAFSGIELTGIVRY